MKSLFFLLGFGLLSVIACRSRDEQLRQSIIGVWTCDRGAQVVRVSSDGSFDQTWYNARDRGQSFEYKGIWHVSGGDFISTLTNKTAKKLNLADMATLGSPERLRLILVDKTHLLYEFGGLTNQWARKT
jgi:hypothetical protein